MDELPENYRHDLAIIRETAKQILRDMNVEGFEIDFSGNEYLAFDELKAQLSPVVHKLFSDDKRSFQSLLYRIDIDEKEYKKALAETGSVNFDEKISELIIRREFKKVITRRFFDPSR